MKSNSTAWRKLLMVARSQPEVLEAGSPLGFSTRVVSLANLTSRRGSSDSIFARVSWPALGVATLAAAVAVATNFKPVLNSLSDDVAALSEPVPETPDTSA